MAPRIRSPKLILALLTALYLLNYLDRYVLSAVLAKIQDDLSLSNFVAGWLPSVFLIGYFATSPVFGGLGDRGRARDVAGGGIGLRNVLMAAGVAVWSVATVASGLAQSAASLVVARAFVGIGEASYGTLAPPLIEEIAPPGRKSSWMSFFSAATPIGSALGYLAGGAIEHAYGWRSAFYLPGVLGVAAAAFCLLLSPDLAGNRPARNAGASQEGRTWGVVRALLSIGLYRGAVLGYCAYTFAIGGFAYFAPKYVHARYGLETGAASVKFGLLTVLGGTIGTLLGGFLADAAVRRERRALGTGDRTPQNTERAPRDEDDATARANVRVCAVACAVGTPLALGAICAPTAATFFALALPCQIALFVLSGPINVALLRSAPLALRASAMAVCIFAIHAFGDLWSTPLIGLIADHAPMQTAMYVVPVAFLLGAIVWWRGASASPRLT